MKSLPTVAKYMLARIGVVTTAIIALLTVIAIWGVVATGDTVTGIIIDAFRAQLQRHAGTAATQLAAFVQTEMDGIERDVVRTAAVHLEQAFGNSDSPVRWAGADDAQFPLLPLEDDTLYDDSPLIRDAVSGALVRAERRSTWAFNPGYAVTARARFVREHSSTLDLLIPTMLDTRPSAAQVYGSFYDGGLIRITPGLNATRLLTLIDGTQRSWFVAAAQSMATAQTDPYLDAGGLGWMVTLSTPVRSFAFNGSVGPAVGVVGADVTIGQLQRRVQDVSVFNRNAGHLITGAGRVVASPFFDGQESARRAYADGSPEALAAQAPLAWEVLPFMDEALWARLRSAPEGSGALRHEAGGRTYLIASASVRGAGPSRGSEAPTRFVALVAVEEAEVLQPFRLLSLRTLSSVGAVVGWSLFVIVIVVFAIGFTIVRFAWHITAPLKLLVSVSDAIISAAAAAASSTGLRHSASTDAARLRAVIDSLPDEASAGGSEIAGFVAAFKAMLRGTKQHAARVAQDQGRVEPNPFFVGPPGTPGEATATPWQRHMREAGIPFGEPGVDLVVTAPPAPAEASFVDATEGAAGGVSTARRRGSAGDSSVGRGSPVISRRVE